jgi:glutamate-5-semialdehyde dehydrogenase
LSEVLIKAKQAQTAARELAKVSATVRNNALMAMAEALTMQKDFLLNENAADVAQARANGTEESLIDRLMLNGQRIDDIAAALQILADQNDPLGKVLEGRTLQSGIRMQRITVPLGVVAMIYEARPNVTADAAGLTLKTGNACILRGGSMANRSNIAMTKVLYDAGIEAGLPKNWLQSIETTDRSATTELMNLHGLIDVLIPRGSASLIKTTVENSRVPVIETGAGNCHLYLHETADPNIIIPIAINAKTQRPGVCNALESILVDAVAAEHFLPALIEALVKAGVVIHADETALGLAQGIDGLFDDMVILATEEDWGREYLSMELSIKCVSGVDEAISHINTYSTHHSESILSRDYEVINRFLHEVDSAAVYANASTRFTDGAEFGLGAEIGISTQKLHARGPMGLEALTSSKFILEGDGQIR